MVKIEAFRLITHTEFHIEDDVLVLRDFRLINYFNVK